VVVVAARANKFCRWPVHGVRTRGAGGDLDSVGVGMENYDSLYVLLELQCCVGIPSLALGRHTQHYLDD
jgi:hypothetical protein